MAKKSAPKGKSNRVPPDLTVTRGILLVTLSLLLLLSLYSFSTGDYSQNTVGWIGFSLGHFFHALFGLGSYFIPLFIGWAGWRLMFHKPIHHPYFKLFFTTLFLISLCMLLSILEVSWPAATAFFRKNFYSSLWQQRIKFHLGGAPFYYLTYDLPSFGLHRIFNTAGLFLIFSSTLVASIFYLAKITPAYIFSRFQAWWRAFREEFATVLDASKDLATKEVVSDAAHDEQRMVKLRIPDARQHQSSSNSSDLLAIQPETNLKVRPSISRKERTETVLPVEAQQFELPKAPKVLEKSPPVKKRDEALNAQRIHNGDFTTYSLPDSTLLTSPKKVDQNSIKKDLRRQAEVLEETLLSFGIEAKVGQINCGPTITSFEVHPSIGVKVQKIKALENDIALNMEAKSLRIIAPIPGKAAVGIEVPNPQPQEVSFKEMLSAYEQSQKKFQIPILLGKAVNGDNVMNDLTKMPHCIIAGATGSGKSVCINTIVITILMTAKPDEIRLIMVDPKKVELTPYTRLPHMLAPVITEPQGAYAAMTWLVKEMENRYEILKLTGTRNIEAFNNRKIDKDFEASLDREIPVRLPFIVGIIDELADLMMVSTHDIETPIARIAQMARAVGIHLILATQRPSREVITGLIKANFPTRISFKVSSRINSQIVLDDVGAETLLGNGDMLFLPPGSAHLVRAQGAFIRDEDINAVVKHICDQAPPNYVIQSFDRLNFNDSKDDSPEEAPTDSLYQDALDIILSTGTASTTFLQRKLKIGYARAASLVDQLETKGILGPADGSKPRRILVSRAGASKAGNGDDAGERKNEDSEEEEKEKGEE